MERLTFPVTINGRTTFLTSESVIVLSSGRERSSLATALTAIGLAASRRYLRTSLRMLFAIAVDIVLQT
ncbi:MAG: hypothetical protein R2729_24065 [Bryobacteraceae bacterium]